jgi:hypothetical protein
MKKTSVCLFSLTLLWSLFFYISVNASDKTFQPYYISNINSANVPLGLCAAFWAGNSDTPTTVWLTGVTGNFKNRNPSKENTAQLTYQAICLCDSKFKSYRDTPCKALTSPNCKCGDSNNDIVHSYKPENGAYFLTSEDYTDSDGKIFRASEWDQTVVVVYPYTAFPEPSLKNAQKNSDVTTETDWHYTNTLKAEGSITTKVTKPLQFCGDGSVQKDKNEKCDDGDDNGKNGFCNCDCSGKIPANSPEKKKNCYEK